MQGAVAYSVSGAQHLLWQEGAAHISAQYSVSRAQRALWQDGATHSSAQVRRKRAQFEEASSACFRENVFQCQQIAIGLEAYAKRLTFSTLFLFKAGFAFGVFVCLCVRSMFLGTLCACGVHGFRGVDI